MKIKDILKQKDELWQEINSRDKETQKLRDKASKLRQKLEKFFLNNNLFSPIEDLKKYEGEGVEEITLITDKKKQKHFSYGDIMKIEDGHFYFSDYEQGIYEYNEKDEKYHSHFYYHKSQGDKINRDILDNRKNNLRLVNYQINVLNSSLRRDNKTGYKCVFLNKQTGKYYSQVRRNGKINYLGSADTVEQAKQLYDKYVLEDNKDANTDSV